MSVSPLPSDRGRASAGLGSHFLPAVKSILSAHTVTSSLTLFTGRALYAHPRGTRAKLPRLWRPTPHLYRLDILQRSLASKTRLQRHVHADFACTRRRCASPVPFCLTCCRWRRIWRVEDIGHSGASCGARQPQPRWRSRHATAFVSQSRRRPLLARRPKTLGCGCLSYNGKTCCPLGSSRTPLTWTINARSPREAGVLFLSLSHNRRRLFLAPKHWTYTQVHVLVSPHLPHSAPSSPCSPRIFNVVLFSKAEGERDSITGRRGAARRLHASRAVPGQIRDGDEKQAARSAPSATSAAETVAMTQGGS